MHLKLGIGNSWYYMDFALNRKEGGHGVLNPSEMNLPSYGVWRGGEDGIILVLTRLLSTDPTVAEFVQNLNIKKQFKNCNGMITVLVIE